MEFYHEYLEFVSKEYSKIVDVTHHVNGVIERSTYSSGLVGVIPLHTTLGAFVGERGEPGLPRDLERLAYRLVPQDRRSSRGQQPDYLSYLPRTVAIPMQIDDVGDYEHDCSKNELLKGKVDIGHNFAEHARKQILTESGIWRPFMGGLVVLGTFEGMHLEEFDGRSDDERQGREVTSESGRKRKVLVCAFPAEAKGGQTTFIEF